MPFIFFNPVTHPAKTLTFFSTKDLNLPLLTQQSLDTDVLSLLYCLNCSSISLSWSSKAAFFIYFLLAKSLKEELIALIDQWCIFFWKLGTICSLIHIPQRVVLHWYLSQLPKHNTFLYNHQSPTFPFTRNADIFSKWYDLIESSTAV